MGCNPSNLSRNELVVNKRQTVVRINLEDVPKTLNVIKTMSFLLKRSRATLRRRPRQN